MVPFPTKRLSDDLLALPLRELIELSPEVKGSGSCGRGLLET